MPADHAPARDSGGVQCYAVRRVNPFLGVLQVVETDDGRAVSTNGVVWDIAVRAERAPGWGSLNRDRRETGLYRYGLWSEAEGLVRRPLAPHLDDDPLTRQCQALIEAIDARADALPFRLEDRHELWLFDPEDRALALLASTRPGDTRPSPEPRHWTSSIGAEGVPSQRRFPAAAELEAMVRQRAGFNTRKHWITRNDDGGGTIDADGRQLPPEAFPPLLLAEQWSAPEQVGLVGEFLAWIAPSLLTLQHLARDTRERLERCLDVQAASIEHHWHLYPEIIDENRVKVARVQCALEKTSGD